SLLRALCVFAATPRLSLVVLCFLRFLGHRELHSFPTRRSSDLAPAIPLFGRHDPACIQKLGSAARADDARQDVAGAHVSAGEARSEEHTSELQSRENLVCRLLLEKKKRNRITLKDAHTTCDYYR